MDSVHREVCRKCYPVHKSHFSFKKKAYLKKHMRRKHCKAANAIAVGTDAPRKRCEDSDDSDCDEDPGALLIGTVSDDSEDEADVWYILETTSSTSNATDEDLGRVVRKRTQPAPVVGSEAVKRNEETKEEEEKEDRLSDGDEVPMDRADKVPAEKVDSSTGFSYASVVQRRPETIKIGIQSGRYRKRQKEVTVIKYMEGRKDIEKIIEVDEFFNM